MALAVALASACANVEGEPDDPDVELMPGDDVVVTDGLSAAADAGLDGGAVDVAPLDAGVDVGVDVGRDAGVDVGRDTGSDVGCVGPTSRGCGTCGTQTHTCSAGS